MERVLKTAKYRVTFEVHASTSVYVQAISEDEARDKACRKVQVSVCADCALDFSIGDVGGITEVEEVSDE